MIFIPEIGTISRIIGLLVLSAGVFAVAYCQNIRFQLMHGVVLLFGIWAGITYFWSIEPIASQKTLFTYVQNIVMMWLIYQWATNTLKINALFLAYVIGAGIAICATIYGYLNNLQINQRYTATGFNPNDLAYILSFSIPMAWYLFLNEKRKYFSWFYGIYPAVALFAIILTGSRGGFIAALIGISFIILSYRELSLRLKIILLIASIIAIYMLGTFIPLENILRIKTIGSELETGDLNSRIQIWRAGLYSLSQSPMGGVGALWGRGVGCFPNVIAPILSNYSAHNVFLSMLVEVGAIGILIFMCILIVAFLNIKRMPNPERLLWIVLLAAWIIASLTSNLQWRKETWLLFGLLVAHVDALRIKQEIKTAY